MDVTQLGPGFVRAFDVTDLTTTISTLLDREIVTKRRVNASSVSLTRKDLPVINANRVIMGMP